MSNAKHIRSKHRLSRLVSIYLSIGAAKQHGNFHLGKLGSPFLF